jgi:hypothetical protein
MPEPTATRVSEVDPGARTPSGPDDDGGGSGVNVPGSPEFGARFEPDPTQAVPGFDGVSKNWKVLLTNLLLAIILLITMFTASAVFNETITEHRGEFQGVLSNVMAPFQGMAGAVQRLWPANGLGLFLERLIGPALVLALAALIYTFSDPSIGWNGETALLFASMLISIFILTYVAEGGESLLADQRFGVPTAVRLYPFALFIAIGFTFLGRAVDFQAPIMFGFIATATALTALGLQGRDAASAVLAPSVALLAIAVGAWFLLDPLRDAVESSEWWASLPNATAALLFVGGVEGLLFVMVPLSFTDGGKLFRYYRPFWLAIVGVAAFFFSWVLLIPQAEGIDAILQRRVIFICSIVAAYAATAFLFWFYFRSRPIWRSEEA